MHSNGRCWVCRRPEEIYVYNCAQQHDRFCGGRVMIWNEIAAHCKSNRVSTAVINFGHQNNRDLLFSKTFRTTHNYSMYGSSSRATPWDHAVNPIEHINDDFNHSFQRRPHAQTKLPVVNVRQALHEVCNNILQA